MTIDDPEKIINDKLKNRTQFKITVYEAISKLQTEVEYHEKLLNNIDDDENSAAEVHRIGIIEGLDIAIRILEGK